MHKNLRPKTSMAVIAVAAVCGAGWQASTGRASDHDEAPLVKADAAQDVTDVYVFNSAPGKTTIIVCWAGFHDNRPQPDEDPLFDPKALYTIHVDNDGDDVADHKIYWRYGVNAQDQYGVRWENVPGADAPAVGLTETVFPAGQFARVWTGHAEDPFFFDALGYLTTIDTGMVSFPSNGTPQESDFLAGLNVTAAAIEIENDVLTGGNDNPIQVWATASRKG